MRGDTRTRTVSAEINLACNDQLPCCSRVLRKVPETIDTFAEKAAALLSDRHHGVLLSGVTLMQEICELDPSIIEQYRRHVPMLCKILRSLLMSGFAPEHDVGGITDPFLQVKVCSSQTVHTFVLAVPVALLHSHQFVDDALRICRGIF